MSLSLSQKINNLESAVSDLQTKSYGIRYENGSGVETITGTISFNTVQHTINIDSSNSNSFKITHAGFYRFGFNLEMTGVPTSSGGVAIRKQGGSLLFVSGGNDSYAENGTTMAYLNVDDEIYCYVWEGSIDVRRGYGRRNFWIHSI